jgi:predicted nuclease of predicted toxin-antitoxin system
MRPTSSRSGSTMASAWRRDQPAGTGKNLADSSVVGREHEPSSSTGASPARLRSVAHRSSHRSPPAEGSTDDEIVEHALHGGYIIVTSNHDMMQLCAEAGQRFVWLDPRSRQLTRAKQLLLILEQIDRWQQILETDATTCVHSMRTKCEAIAPAEAARLATQRMKVNERRKRTKQSAPRPAGPLLGEKS